MMSHRTVPLICCGTLLSALLPGLRAQQAPLEQVVRTAADKSTLAAAGNAPFHLKATIADEKAHDPQWNATVEEWWQSPKVYRREFRSAAFTQILVVDGSRVEEHDNGSVFPELLRNLATELVTPVPRYDQLAALHQTMPMPDGSAGQIVATWEIRGSDNREAKAIQASVAVSRQTGLFTYGGDLDWDVALHDFTEFHGKQIARRLTAQAGRGPTLTARVTMLEDLQTPTATLFRITSATPSQQQLRTVVVHEAELRRLLIEAPTPAWPVSTKPGSIIMRIVVDRTGQVRSVDDFYSDDPAAQPAAEAALLQWRYRPYLDHGSPVQVISTVTLPLR